MRCLAAMAVASVALLVRVPAPAYADSPGTPGGGAFGSDRQAVGSLLGDGSAEAVAQDGSDIGDPTAPRGGGGNVICHYYDDATGASVNPWGLPSQLNGSNVMILRACVDADTGEYVSVGDIVVVPPLVPQADPRDLAVMARSRLPLPLPEARMNPQGDQTVNLETWLWVDNWQTQTRSATASGATSAVAATPVEP